MRAVALPALALLAACSGEADPAAAPVATSEVLPAKPRTLIPADLDPATLGPKVEGMTIEDVPLGGRRAPFARLGAFVACPRDMAACDPAAVPAGTRYTYVLTVTPLPAPAPTDASSATPPPVPLVAPSPPTLATIEPVPGFQGGVGYALAEAKAALGKDDALSVTLDGGRIVWSAGEGLRWLPGAPITFWWQSTRPPELRDNAYSFASGIRNASIRAPFPAADKAVERAARP